MSLIIQIRSLVVSFLFGIIMCLFFNLFYYLLFSKYKAFNCISNLVFSLFLFGNYFLLLYIVNGGIIHIYFLLMVFISFLIYNRIFVKLRVKWKKISFK